jgi:hypothetical protein
MKDKTIKMNWPEWQDYCFEHGINPRKQCEDGQDLGGGHSLTIECVEDPPEGEVSNLKKEKLLEMLEHWKKECQDNEEQTGSDCEICGKHYLSVSCKQAYQQIKKTIQQGIPILWEHDRFKVFRPPGRNKKLDAQFVAVLKDAIRHGVGEKEFLEGIIKEYEKSEKEQQ